MCRRHFRINIAHENKSVLKPDIGVNSSIKDLCINLQNDKNY